MANTKTNTLNNYTADSGVRDVLNQGHPDNAGENATGTSAYESPKQNSDWKDIIDIAFRNRQFGDTGSVILLPAIATTLIFIIFQYLLGTPSRIASTVLLNLLALGPVGYILGARFKPYEYAGRVFLVLAIVALAMGIVAGILAGVGYILYLLFKLVVILVKAAIAIIILGGIIAFLFSIMNNDGSDFSSDDNTTIGSIVGYRVDRIRVYKNLK